MFGFGGVMRVMEWLGGWVGGESWKRGGFVEWGFI